VLFLYAVAKETKRLYFAKRNRKSSR
jgi:hypothetical protein